MKHKRILYSAALLAIACCASECAAQTADNRAPATQMAPSANAPSPAAKQKVAEEYGKLPLSFEANHGQTDPKVKFLSRGPGYKLFLLPHEAVLMLQRERRAKSQRKVDAFRSFAEPREREAIPAEIIRMSLLGASRDAQVTGVEEMRGTSNYFIGNDPSQWRTNVPNYAKVHYQRVYPGIDLVYHGSHQQLEYDFIVAPGADPRQIRLGLKGAKKLELTPEGDLLLSTSGEPVRLHKPVIYQEFDGKRKQVDGSFVLAAKNTVKFRVGKYDASQSLIIDPVLAYSTLLGGNGFDEAFSIAVDANGAAYVTGLTTSTNFAFPNPGAFQTTLNTCGTSPCEEAFVAKLNPAGNGLVYVTYLGGTGFSEGNGIAVFGGNAYVTGTTTAANFPTLNPFQASLKGSENVFVTQLNATGSALVFSTYLGGSSSEFSGSTFGGGDNPIAVDGAGNAYVTGTTTSGNFPTTPGAFLTASGGGVFRSTDSAATWNPSSSGLTSANITVFAVDPTAPTTHIVYAGTSDLGIFKSTNNGGTWAASNNGLGTLNITALLIDPKTPATLYAGTFGGVFKSIDSAATWTPMNNGLVIPNTTIPVDVQTLATDPASSAIYAGSSNGAFKTINGGANWTSLNAGFPLTNGVPFAPEITSMVVDPVTPATIYAGTLFQGVFKTLNGGVSWTAIDTGLTLPGTSFLPDIRALAIDAMAPSNLYATAQNGVGVYKAMDGGAQWSLVNAGLTDLNTTGIVADPTVSDTLYVGTLSTGVFKTTNGGVTWTTTTNALSNFIVGPLAVDPIVPTNVYAGSSVLRAFAAKFSASGTIGYSTYLGGSSEEFGASIAVDSLDQAYITGGTISRNFPKANAFQATRQGPFDAFVTKMNSSGSGLVYSTYLGGSAGFSEGFGIAVDAAGSAYVTGETGASNFPNVSAFQTTNGGTNAFVTKFNPAGSALVYSTFLGGSSAGGGFSFDQPQSIAVDGNLNAWVMGFTEELNFPTAKPIRSSPPCEPTSFSSCLVNVFVSEVNPSGSALLFSTYLGPTQGFSQGGGIAVDSGGNAYITGTADSSEFPALNPPLGTPAAGLPHAFVSKIASTAVSTDLAITLGHSPDPVSIGQNIKFTSTIRNNGPSAATGVTFYPTQVPNSTIHLFKTLATETASQGTCDSNEFCLLGTLASGASATVVLNVTTFTGQEGAQTVAVGVGGNESDPIPANNVATTTVNVLGAVDLRLAGTASPAPVVLGGNLTYLLVVNNRTGPSPATGVTLTDTLPAGVTFVSAGATQGTCTGTTTVVCALGTVAVAGTASVQIVVTPTTVGTITNNSIATANEVNNSAGKNVLRQVSDVVAVSNLNNSRMKGNYAFLFQGATADALMAFAGSFVADGNGNLTNGISDTNTSAGVLPNVAFTGTYNVGADNRGTMIITPAGGVAQTYRFALGLFNSQGVATKARFIAFDAGRKGAAGVIEMQDPTAFSMAAIKGNFAFGASGEDGNAIHFAAAGRLTTDGLGNITNGLEDTDAGGVPASSVAFTGTYGSIAANGRGTFALNFPGAPGPTNYALYVVSANETFTISLDPRSSTTELSSGQTLRQQTANFSNAWLKGNGVFNLNGAPGSNTATDVSIGLATADGAGNITLLSDDNNDGVVSLNQTSSGTTYSVAASGRTTFAGTGTQPVLYLLDLNKGFLVDTGTNDANGSLEPQSGGPFNNASISGNFFLGNLTPNALSVDPINGVVSIDGAGNFSATEDGSSAGVLLDDVVFTGTYLVSPNGRIIDSNGTILYLVSPTKAFSIGAKSGKTGDLVTVVEGSALPAAADLSITKSASVTQAVIGEQFFYNLSVKNNGPGLATGVVVTDSLPAGITFALATASQGVCSGPAPVVCSLGAVPNGSIVDISIIVTAAAAGSAQNSTTVSANETDPNLANNSASSAPVTILSTTDLTLITTVTPDSVILGSNLTFSVTATNIGSQGATGVTVKDTLPAGVTFVSATPPAGFPSCTAVAQTVTCVVGGLLGGASYTVKIVATSTATGTITNTATVTLTELDPTLGDNTASASATVLPSAGTSERYLLTDSNSPTVLDFDTATNTPQGTAHAGTNPEGIAISPNGRLAFVANLNSNYVSVIDLTLNAEIARIRGIRASRHLALNSDGTRLVVPNLNADEVDIIDTSNFQILKRVSINGLVGDDPNNPNDIGQAGVVTAGNFAYINTNSLLTTTPTRVAVIDLTTFAASSVPGTDVGFARVRGGRIAATPDGRFVAIPRFGPNVLLIIDATTNRLIQTVNLTAPPASIVITRNANDTNGVFGYLGQVGNTVSVFDFRPGLATFGQPVPGAKITLTDNIVNGNMGITADGNRVIVTAFPPTAVHNVIVLDTQQLRGATPANSIVTQFRAGGTFGSIDGIDVGLTQPQPPANAPVVSIVTPTSIVNDAPTQVHITGSGFAAGALVRVGSLDPVAASNVSSTDLDITLPQFMPAQNSADVIVTNPNAAGGVAGQQISGILRGALTINNGIAFQPANEVTVSDAGDNAVAILNNATQSVSSVPASPGPLGEAISVDGLRAYVGSFRGRAVDVINLNTKTLDKTIALAADTNTIGQIDAIVTAPNPATGGAAEFLLTGFNDAATNGQNLRVVLIDADSTSPTFNAIVKSLPASLTTAFPGALAVMSDGHFAYANDANTGNLVILNVQTGASTVVPASALANATTFQAHIEVTQDNKSLILVSNPGSLLVFDIGVNPLSPTLITTITGTPPAGLQPLFLGNFRVVGKRLYAIDTAQAVVQAFNFDRAAANFSPLGSFTIPGIANFFSSGFAVTPDGALIYTNLDQDDSVAVIDTTQLLASSSTSLVTKFHVGLTPSAIIISPGKALIAGLAITKTAVPTTTLVGTAVTYTMALTNSGPSSSTGVAVTDVLPAGVTFVSATPSQGTCTGTATVTCSLGTLANGATASISLTVKATAAGSIVNTATVTENETNATPANATASAAINVINTTACGGASTSLWTNQTGDGQWTNPLNWNTLAVPKATDDVCIDTPLAATTVTLANSQQSVHSLVAASNFVLSNTSATTSLTVATTSTFLNALTLNGATLNTGGSWGINGLFTSSGTSSIGAPVSILLANGGLTISGTLTVIGNRLANFGPGTLNSGSTMQLSGGATFDNNSSLAINGAQILTSPNSLFTNKAGATVTIAGGSTISTPVSNLGNVSVNSGSLNLTGGFNQLSGVTALNGGGIVTNSPLVIGGGSLAGNGTISGGVTVGGSFGGTLSPGFSPGTISVSGVYAQSATGTYNAEIGGLTAGTQYDQITGPANGTATLNGTLNVSLINGFVPVAGNSFTILSCGVTPTCITGTFTTVNLPALPNGLGWTIAYNPTSVVLSVTAAASADLSVAKGADVASSHLGGPAFTYNITITNNGPPAATGITLTDPLPSTVSLSSVTPSQGTCTSGATVTCSLGSLVSRAKATVSILVTPAAVGSIANTVTVAANEPDPVPANNSASVTVPVLATADLALQKTFQPNGINVGATFTYTLAVTNNGPSSATGVTLTDALPAGLTFVSSNSSQGNCSGTATVTCALGTLANTVTATVRILVTPTIATAITNTATVTLNEFDPNLANNTASVTLTPTFSADLFLTKTAAPSPAGIGSNLTYTLTVTNNGPSSATNVTLTDTLPASPTFVSAASTQGTCSGTTTVTCTIGTLPNAAAATVTIIVKPVAAGSITNTASVTATEPDPNPASNTASVNTTVTASADLAVTKIASLATTHLGAGPFTYTVTVTNNGPSPATGVTLSDALPAGVQLFAAPTFSQGACNANTPISCALGTLANGASATVSIQVQPIAVGSPVNTATVTANEADPVPANNSSSVTVQILPSADVALTKTAQPNPVNAGSPLTYTLTVTNNGPSPATGVKITDILPAGATFASASPACTGTSTVTCNFATLGVNASATATITVTPTGSGALSNSASATANEFDPIAANNTATAGVTVVPVADLALTKTASPSPVGIGSNLTYTLIVTNNGPSTATGVTLTDSLPATTTFVNVTPTQGTCSGTTTVTCNLGTLANAAKATVTIIVRPTLADFITNTASVTATETDPNLANNTASVTIIPTASADLALTETVAPNPILLGANLTYTLTITNNGPSPTTNVVLTDTLPTGATFVGTTPSQGTCTNPLSTCSIGNLASGASATVIVVVKPNATGAFSNSASVAANENDPNTANNSVSASATVNPATDLSLAENATPQSVTTGNNVTFSFTVSNAGPSTATGVTLADTLPVGMIFVSATPPVCTAAVSCNLGTIANAATATLSIVAKATAPGNFNNTGNVSANEADPFPSNNTAIASVTVVASADMAIAVSASPNPAGVGGSLTFTMTVTNNGPSPATGVLVVGGFTTGATIVSITPSQGSPCTGTSQFNCNLGALASGARAVVIAVVTPTAPGTFSTTDSVAANEPDPVTTNNSATVSVNVVTAPVVTLSAASLNFASQPVGSPSAPQSVTLANTSAALPLTNLTIAASGDFAQTNNCGTSLAALSSCSIFVTFKPTATGTRTGAITISDNAVGSPQTVSLTGIGINAPAITLSPVSLIFSSRLVGSASPALPITMTNSGNATLNIASIAITGTDTGDFSQTNTCGQTLAQTASCTINVVFKPTAGGQRTAGVAITSDARGSVPVITLSGTGLSAGLDLSSSLLIFDNQTVGTTSASQTVTLSNGGATAVAITSITATGDFAQTNTCNNSVAASSNCAIRVTFTPTATGTRTGAVSIVSSSSTPLTVNLTGTGVVVTLSLSPASLTFNDQKVGTSSQSQSVTLTNTGGAALTINSIVPSGDFLEADNCGSGLAAGAGCSINVTFLPTTTGARTGSITVTSNAQGSPHTAKLTGNGISRGPAVGLTCTTGSVASSCTSLTFAAQAVNTTSGPQQVTLTNTGNDTLNISSIAASGDFAASNCPATLAASASCNISVTFTPTTTSTRAGSLVIKDNSGDSPQFISLTGTGTPSGPAVSLSATAVAFGNQLITSTSPAQSVTLTNTGNAALAITSIKPSGDFAETDNCGTSVAANAFCTISVTFTPTATGARAGAITISDNAPANPQAITLSGEGTDITITVPPGGSTSANISAGQPATFPLSLAPAGGFSGSVTVSCIGAIPAGTCTSSPSSFTLDAPVTITTTVTTTAPSHATVLPVPRLSPRNFAPLRAMTQVLLLLVAFLAFFIAALRRRRAWLAVTAGLFLVAFAAGCAGGAGNPGVVGPTLGTPANTYTVTVVVKTASGATRSMPLTVIVH